MLEGVEFKTLRPRLYKSLNVLGIPIGSSELSIFAYG